MLQAMGSRSAWPSSTSRLLYIPVKLQTWGHPRHLRAALGAVTQIQLHQAMYRYVSVIRSNLILNAFMQLKNRDINSFSAPIIFFKSNQCKLWTAVIETLRNIRKFSASTLQWLHEWAIVLLHRTNHKSYATWRGFFNDVIVCNMKMIIQQAVVIYTHYII